MTCRVSRSALARGIGRRPRPPPRASARIAGIVALDERLGPQIAREVGIRRLRRAATARRRSPGCRPSTDCPAPLHLGTREVGAFDADADAPHVARIVDAVLRRAARQDGRRLEQVALDAPADRQPLRVFRRLADRRAGPSGLSSRTTSPVSVTHDEVRSPANASSTRNAGIGRLVRLRPLAADLTTAGANTFTISRLPIAIVTVSLRSVAGSNTTNCCCVPGLKPCAASRRGRFRLSTGTSSRSRSSVCVPLGGLDRQADVLAGDAAGHLHGPGARIEREVERAQRELAIDAAPSVRIAAARRGAEQRHLQARVLQQLEAVGGRHGLADGEADLLAAVVDAAPLRRRAVAREVGRQVERPRLQVGAVQHDAHGDDPAGEDEQRHGARDAARHRRGTASREELSHVG